MQRHGGLPTDGRRAPRLPHGRPIALLTTALALLVGLLVVEPSGGPSPVAAQAPTVVPGGDVTALRAAVAVGGVIELQPGGFELSEELPIDVDGTELRATEPGATTIVLAAGIRGRVVDVGASGVTIDGVVVTGGDASNGTGGGIRVGRGAELTLVRSRVTANVARDGAGIDNAGSLALVDSTVDGNTAERKGGGLLNGGTATVRNATLVSNTASQGGAVSSPGTIEIRHATIVRNVATSSSSAGIDRNGGDFEVYHSIIGANLRANGTPASDCSGTPDLLEVNLVSDDSGCNPVGEVVVAPPGVGALRANGGPTPTAAPLPDSPAIDVVPLTAAATCASGVDADQRGTTRPSGPGCDLGAVERAPIDVDIALDVDTSAYEARGLPVGTVEVGLTSAAVEDVLDELVTRTATAPDDGSTPPDTSIRSISIRSITIEDLSIRSIGPEAASIRSITLGSISIRSIAQRFTSIRSIGLPDIPLSEIPLTSDGGWEAVLAGTQFAGVPLQSITLADLELADDPVLDARLEALTLEDVDVSYTSIRSISIRSILLAGISVRSIAVDGYDPDPDGTYTSAWCDILGDLCGDGEDQLTAAEIGAADLLALQFAGADVDDVPVFDIPLGGLSSTFVAETSIRSIPLESLFIENSSIRSISIRSISIRSIDALRSIIDCDGFPQYCVDDDSNTFTLGDVATATPEALIGTVGDLLDLPADLLVGLSLGDLLLAFVTPDAPPWEQLDLEAARVQNLGEPPQPTFDYVVTVTVQEVAADLALTVQLPPGFAAARRADDPAATFDGEPVVPTDDDLGMIEVSVPGVEPGDHELRIPARAGIVTGDGFAASASVFADSGDDTATAGPATTRVDVVEARVGDGGPNAIAALDVGDLRLAHVTSSDDADLYRFTPPAWADGATARVLLANIPNGVDLDLAAYEPLDEPLRAGEPDDVRRSLGEVRYDLDPDDDVLPTDIVDDLALDVPGDFGIPDYAPRDVSSRRSGADEEVVLPGLVAGVTYYVAVTPFLAATSNFPYSLRLRLEDTGQPIECRAGDRVFPHALGPPATQEPIPADVDTLYVTNTTWLAGEVSGSVAAEILDAARATAGVGGVQPAVVAVDADPGVVAAYDAWARAENRCSVDARNDVVREIGRVLDGIIETRPGVENIVIIGGDGVVPMAAVRDRTEYANEATFARDVLTAGAANELSGALDDATLLTDDPYATSAPIEITNANAQLHLPELAIGRLVETGPQVLQALRNFVTFDGRLDPATLPGWNPPTATVTGYDFLADGADEVAQRLAAVADTTTRTDDAWDDADFLDLFAAGGGDLISPNAHYDPESLLPAAADGTLFSDQDLVSTADFDGTGPAQRPDRAAVFSVGCHAGLSVSDVQLGLPALDWAELYAGGDNAWLAHTSFGYGDTDFVAYSERHGVNVAAGIAAMLAGDVDAPETMGEVNLRAKEQYLASILVLSPYDEKILQSFTFYGLPMYRIGGGSTAGAASTPTAAPGDAGPGSPVTYGAASTDSRTGLDVTPVTIELSVDDSGTGTSASDTINLVSTDDGDYYEVGGNTVSGQYRPIQPLVVDRIPDDVGEASGLFVTGATSEDRVPFAPRYLRPTIDLDANERRIESLDASFPSVLQRVTTERSGNQQLLVAAGQYLDDATTGQGLQRLYTTVRGDLYEPGPLSDGVGPTFRRVTANVGVDDGVVFFEVETGAPTPDDDAVRVAVLSREAGSNEWRSLELFRSSPGSSTWVGGFRPGAAGPVEAKVWAVDGHGDVSSSDNKVRNYLATVPVEVGDLDITVVDPAPTNGYYAGPATVEITSGTADPGGEPPVIEYSVDSRPFQDYTGPFTVSGDGGHAVIARDGLGSQQLLYFVIDASPPLLTAERSPDIGDDGWSAGDVSVLLDAVDVGQSGVDRIVYRASGATTIPETEVSGDAAVIDGFSPGETTLTAWSVDVAGNESEPITVAVRIDLDAPTLAGTIDPPPNAAGWNRTVATIELVGSDASSEVTQVVYTATGATTLPETVVAGGSATIDGLAEGVTTVVATAVDAAGNVSQPVSVPVRIDTSAPTVAGVAPRVVTGEPATVTFSCGDDGSGVAACELLDALGQVVAVGQPGAGGEWTGAAEVTDTSVIGDAGFTVRSVDIAGNEGTADVMLTVGPDACLLYDPDQAKNIGSNYTIKLQLCDDQGTNLSSRQITLTALTIDGVADPGPNDSGNANAGYEFRFNAQDRSYIYNLDTTGLAGLGSGPHELFFTTEPVDDRDSLPVEELQTLATNSAPFTLR